MKYKILSFAIFCIILTGCNGGADENSIEESGTVEITNAIVSSESNGRVEKIFFSEGEEVTAGDTLLIIDHELLEIKLAQAQAIEKITKADYQLAKEGARTEDKETAREQFKKAKINFMEAVL